MGSISNGGLRMSGGMSDRTSRFTSGRIPGPIWLRHQESRRSSRETLIVQACSASVRGEYTRERGYLCDGTTVCSDLRSSRARANKPTRYILALERIRAHGYGDDRIRGRPGFAQATPTSIIHVACWKRHWDLHRRKSPSGRF